MELGRRSHQTTYISVIQRALTSELARSVYVEREYQPQQTIAAYPACWRTHSARPAPLREARLRQISSRRTSRLEPSSTGGSRCGDTTSSRRSLANLGQASAAMGFARIKRVTSPTRQPVSPRTVADRRSLAYTGFRETGIPHARAAVYVALRGLYYARYGREARTAAARVPGLPGPRARI